MRPLVFLSAALVAVSAFADTAPVTYDRISLSVSAEEEVENDIVVANLYAQREASKASDAADQVNKSIAWALQRAQAVDGILAQTEGYYSQPVHRNQTLTGWRVRQTLRLESRNPQAMSELVGELQDRLAMGAIQYQISPERRAASEDKLIRQAIGSFSGRARLIATELGRPGYRIVEIDVITSAASRSPIPVQRAAMSLESAAVAAPAIESGTQTVVVNVSGRIELKLE